MATTKAVQIAASGSGSVHAITRLSTLAGAMSDRRRLSNIFQRPSSGMARRRRSMPGGTATEDPWQQLPVAAHPSMRASGRCRVAGGILVHEFDVRRESGPREDAFEQVVAEQRVFGHATRQRRLERVDVVDALADVRSLAAQVLVHVGHGGRVRIDAAGPGDETLIARAFVAERQRRRDSWLQDRVAVDDASAALVEAAARSGDAPSCRPAGARCPAASAYRHRA